MTETTSAPRQNLIDIGEAAELLGVTPRFIRRLIHERRIPHHKIGKFIRFRPSDLERWIAERAVDARR